MQILGVLDYQTLKVAGVVFSGVATMFIKDGTVAYVRRRRARRERELRDESREAIAKMLEQLFPNGGASLADKINRIEGSVASLHTTINDTRKAMGERLTVLENNFANAGRVLAARKKAMK